MAPAGLAPRLYAWLKVGQHVLRAHVSQHTPARTHGVTLARTHGHMPPNA
jgi:hypothetical protein